jgi:hypothetical protein
MRSNRNDSPFIVVAIVVIAIIIVNWFVDWLQGLIH